MQETAIDLRTKTAAASSPRELDEIETLLKAAFVDEVDPGYGWAAPDLHICARSAGRLISHVGIYYRDIRVGEKMLPVVGVGDVATDAAWRRQGLARRLLKLAKERMQAQEGRRFAFLSVEPHLVPYYSALGYRPVARYVYILSRGERIRMEGIRMAMPLHGEEWPAGEIDLLGLPW